MRNLRLLVLTSILAAGPAFATGTAPRTFVSFAGLDTNPCSRTSPCRSFNTAMAQTAPYGSVIALDSAGYGAVTIGQSVSLIAPQGVYAGIAVSSGNGVTISGTNISDVVILRGLTIDGGGTATNGVYVPSSTSVGAVAIENCEIDTFTNSGVLFQPTNAGPTLFVTDTSLIDNNYGIYETPPAAGTPRGSISHCRFFYNTYGVYTYGSNVLVSNSVFTNNFDGVVLADAGSVVVDSCQINGSQNGLMVSNAGAIMRASNTVVVHNTSGLAINPGGLMYSVIGDATYPVKTNKVLDNNVNGSFTGTVSAQ